MKDRVMSKFFPMTLQTLWAAAIVMLLTLSGCSAGIPGFSSSGEAGITKENAKALSAAAGGAKSVEGIPHDVRGAGEEAAVVNYSIALRGEGGGAKVQLSLDKSSYTIGEMEASLDGNKETWSVVAYDKSGKFEKFEYIYAFANKDNALRYLVLMGGTFKAEDKEFFGIEGVLIVPGAGNDIAGSAKTYDIVFGDKFPVTPQYQTMISHADDLLDDAKDGSGAVNSLIADITKIDKEIKETKAKKIEEKDPKKKQAAEAEKKKELAKLEADKKTLQGQLKSQKDDNDRRFVDTYTLRRAIADEYAAFVESNHYTWLNNSGQVDMHKQWLKTKALDGDIEAAYAAYSKVAGDAKKLNDERSKTRKKVTEVDNDSRNPEAA